MKTARLYRMHTDKHICPFGLRSKDLLERNGFEVEDCRLVSRKDTDEFKKQHNVETTPQTFIEGELVGGYDALRNYFNLGDPEQSGTTYTPVIAIFSMAFIIALAIVFSQTGTFSSLISMNLIILFVAISMTILAIQKLQDLYSFTNSFITYDLFSRSDC